MKLADEKIEEIWTACCPHECDVFHDVVSFARAILKAAGVEELEGWQLVPKNPTARMLVDGMTEVDVNCACEEHATPDQVAGLVYSIMLAAAPEYGQK